LLDGEARCPFLVLATAAGEVSTSQCGGPLTPGG